MPSWDLLELLSTFETSVIDFRVSVMTVGGARTFSGCISIALNLMVMRSLEQSDG
jgi:hypothetical protein